MLRLDTHRLVEEFMILANETVARWARRKKLPFIYRVHETPDPDRLERLREFVAGLGLKLAKNAGQSSKALQKLLAQVEGRPIEGIVSTLVLRSMKQARYSAEREDHFGLGSRAYTHFTSPIRRYPDLAIHRIVRSALIEGRRANETLSEHLDDVARQASQRERQATEAERDSVELKRLEYMERHLGDEFAGRPGPGAGDFGGPRGSEARLGSGRLTGVRGPGRAPDRAGGRLASCSLKLTAKLTPYSFTGRVWE
jgi:ribonuclease R